MIAKPETYFHNDQPKFGYGRDGTIYLTCEVVHPRSSVGRKVEIELTTEMQLKLLRLLRTEAIDQRSQPMGPE